MKSDKLTQKFLEDVVRYIHESGFQPHDLLEGQAELGKRFGVSYAVVRKGLKELVRQNLIYRIKGKGTYIAPFQHYNLTYILLFVNIPHGTSASDSFYRFTSQLRSELASVNHRLSVTVVPPDMVGIRKMLYAKQIAGAYFYEMDRNIPSMRELESLLNQYEVPIIYLEARPGEQGQNTVSYDHESIGRMAAAHLIKKGHKRIAMANDQKQGNMALSTEAFKDEASKKGIKAMTINMTNAPWIPKDVILSFDAICVVRSNLSIICLSILEHHKIKVPQDVAMMTVEGLHASRCITPLTSVSLPIEEFAVTAVGELMKKIKDPKYTFSHIKLKPFLEERGST